MVDHEYEKLMALADKFSATDAASAAAALQGPTPMRINRNVAEIEIAGVLEPERIGAYDRWGIKHTAYSDIRAQVADAVSSGVKKIVFKVNSPGGNVLGMLQAMKDIASARKSGIKTETRASGLMASAAYMLGAQSETVIATSEADIVGSIGVVRSAMTFPYFKDITNNESPNKRPDASTEEGVQAIKDELSDIYNVVMPHVAKARNTTMEKINSDWGKGGTMTAKTALARGMIDVIEEPKPAGRSGVTKGKTKMDMATLKAEHPDLYKAAFEAGKEAGAAEFKEMAEAHLSLAEASGAMDRAVEDIKAGNPVGPKVFAFHNAEGIKRAQIQARGDEAPPAVGEGADPQVEAHASKDENADIKAAYAAAGLEVEL